MFATGLNSFVSHSSRELIVEPGSFIEIPCAVSHPTKSISLFLVKPLMARKKFKLEKKSVLRCVAFS